MFKQAIVLLQDYLDSLGFKAQIHFELEGCVKTSINNSNLDFDAINRKLSHLGIDGEVVTEYWHNQWEYVSLFNGQSPLKEADNLARAIHYLPIIFSQHGISETLIKPVVWSGDQGKLALGSSEIFTTDTRAVHIPNAIQINVSVLNKQGLNIIADNFFGEYLQQCFLKTSKDCSLLYLPEEEAFERLKLKSHYGLSAELCSPCDISGGHQGSVALYKELGKHNQNMGEETLLLDQHSKTLLTQHNWQKTARIEHRLGTSSLKYNPYANVLFALMNVIDAIDSYLQGQCEAKLAPADCYPELPKSLYNANTRDVNNRSGAIELFNRGSWFCEGINRVQAYMRPSQSNEHLPKCIGDIIKKHILEQYQNPKIALPTHFTFA
jgi:hypothetical protein